MGSQSVANSMGSNSFLGQNQSLSMNNFMGQPISEDLAFHNNLEQVRAKMEDTVRSLSSKNFESARIDSLNMYKDKPLNKLPFKEHSLQILYK